MQKVPKGAVLSVGRFIMRRQLGIVIGGQKVLIKSLGAQAGVLYGKVELFTDVLGIGGLQHGAIAHGVVIDESGGRRFDVVISDFIRRADEKGFANRQQCQILLRMMTEDQRLETRTDIGKRNPPEIVLIVVL